MPIYITIGYGDQAGYNRTTPAVRNEAHAHDEKLKMRGAQMGIAGSPVQVRNHGGKQVQTTDGPFLQASLPVAGFAFIEADNLQEAIKLVSKTPCAVAYGLVEVWPLEQRT